MSHYERLARRATGVAYILGPLLLTAAAAVYVLGIERSPDGTSSWVEGVLMALAWPLFVPVYWQASTNRSGGWECSMPDGRR